MGRWRPAFFAFVAVSCVIPCSRAACREYTMELDGYYLDPCSSFSVKGNGCFANDLERDLAIETYRWTIYERYKGAPLYSLRLCPTVPQDHRGYMHRASTT
jgi:hypothetical protein